MTTQRTQRPRRAAITGIGVIAPNGLRADAYWKSVREGLVVLDRITREGCEHLPLRIAGEVRSFDAAALIEERFLVQTDRFSHFAMAATVLALDDAGLGQGDPADPYDIGVITAAGSGGGEFGQRELQKLWGQGSRYVGPYQSIAWFYAASTGQISIRGGFKGPCGVVASDEAGGLDAIALAARGVRRGTGAVIVGSAEAPLAPYSMVCQLGYPEISTAEEPGRAYRPFTAGACGFAPAEGAPCSSWRTRPAPASVGRPSGPPWPVTGPRSPAPPAGSGPERGSPTRSVAPSTRPAALGGDRRRVRRRPGCSGGGPRRSPGHRRRPGGARHPRPRHGTQDGHRAGLLRGTRAGHRGRGARHGERPGTPTPNVFDICHDLDLVMSSARPAELHTALVLSRGLMGSNAALVVRRGGDSAR